MINYSYRRELTIRVIGLLLSGLAVLGAISGVWAVAQDQGQTQLTADEIMSRVYNRPSWNDMQAKLIMQVIPPGGPSQTTEMLSYSKRDPQTGETRMLIKFIAPEDVAGIEFLLHQHKNADDDIWVYLPVLGQPKKITASGKAGSFMGSDFSNYDIGGGELEDWHYRLLGEEQLALGGDEHRTYKIEALPVEEAVVEKTGYSRVIKWVDEANFLVLRSDHYDKDGELFKRITVTQTEQIAGIWFETRLEAENLITGSHSVLEFQDIKVNQGLPDALFDPANLGKQ